MTPSQISEYIQKEPYKTISLCAKEEQTKTFIVGGYVRDLLLDRATKDLDIVVEGSGIEFAKALSKKLKGSEVNYFQNFGTAMFRYKEMEIEVVGARKESYRYDSRKPMVENGTIKEDQERRDFTINALSIGLNKSDFGQVIDPFGGLDDLRDRKLITPLAPDQTFSDDPLRMMRAIRFATQLGFFIDENTFEAIKRNADRIKIVSQERITEELNKIVASPRPSIGFKLLLNCGLLQYVFPKMLELHGVERVKGFGHKDNFYHTLKVLDNVAERSNNLWLRWAAILHDIAKPDTKRFEPEIGWTFHGHEDLGARMTPKIFRKLKLPLDHKMKYVQKLVRLHLRPIGLSKEIVSDSAIRRLLFESGEDLEDLFILCESDITSKNESKVERYLQNFKIVREKCKEVEESDRIRNWEPPIGGQEIMDTFGIKPGREVGLIKTAIREAILDGVIKNDKDEAFRFMLSEAEKIGLEPINSKKS